MVSSIGATCDAEAGEDLGIVFHVLPDLQHGGVFQHRLEDRQRRVERHLAGRGRVAEKAAFALAVGERHIGARAGIDGERDADDFGQHLVEAGGLGIDGEIAAVAGAVGEGLQGLGVADAEIGGGVEGQAFDRLGLVVCAGDLMALADLQHRGLDAELLRDAADQRAGIPSP